MKFYLKEMFYSNEVRVVVIPYDMVKKKQWLLSELGNGKLFNDNKNKGKNEFKLRSNLVRAKTNFVTRLLDNFADVDELSLLTLTFTENLQDVRKANKIFNRFMKYLSARHKGIKWVVVYEYQKRGAVHYHMLIDKYFDQEEIRRWWDKKYNLGKFVNLKRCYKKNGSYSAIAKYLSKYMSKSSSDEKSRNQADLNVKSYRFSYNCSKVQSSVKLLDLDFEDLPMLMVNEAIWNKPFKSKNGKSAIGWVSQFNQVDWVSKFLD